uniref:Uncharacterized protein n=1 Tax=Pyrodinium bahamense TaxID=73915 RepID=A0A7S0FBE4_9DINO|mmetsp:Transcript_17584/g.48540  ORF Transcript_17584/g.48540 Transcript_17584/m.48540 type:complete len:100 (+) Transcript_17584:176-475(+)
MLGMSLDRRALLGMLGLVLLAEDCELFAWLLPLWNVLRNRSGASELVSKGKLGVVLGVDDMMVDWFAPGFSPTARSAPWMMSVKLVLFFRPDITASVCS